MPAPNDLKIKLTDSRTNATRATTVTTVTGATKGDRGLQEVTEGDRGRQRATDDFEANLRATIRIWVMEYPGKFTTSDIDRELGLTSRLAKQNRSKCLAVLVSEGIIERDLNRRGVFRKKDNILTEMDILGAKSEELPFDLPFGLSKEIEINNKEIILFMGETNTGKTAVIFNMIWSCLRTLKAEGLLRDKTAPCNNGNFGIRYFSSEMGPTGVLKKLLSFGKDYPPEEWVKYVLSAERNRDFQDVIDPCGFNFIDYLEVFDGEYFKLSSCITAIHSVLDTGVAVIALQKKRGTDIGRGGEATLEKPRLAVALSEDREKGRMTAKIVKAKHYRERNPAGLEKDFVIRRRGTKIIEVSDWGYAKDHQVRRNTVDYHKLYLDEIYG